MTIIAGKNTKAEAVLEMLRKGMTNREIRNRMPVSPSYVSLLKKQMVKKKTKAEPKPKPEPKADNVETILAQRGRDYGDYPQKAGFIQNMKLLIRMSPNWFDLDPDMRESMEMIAHKMGRIAYGDPSHLDSWIDIAGYAKLVSDRLQGNAR
jgi:hypothetical protein